ncbi:T9SS type A sorting domain-containing protein [Dysgonomonas sp. 520]|uniref:T9SS type A sorting domain-containing protein n=1 Tax=Dysgonomonas sp. 520 TaxID=2302931 RepID=UPI0013D4955B|nr:T9SS type A sorting domain-containing protein [Dysgonomonas sp. 520]NDW10800.1 T9SS C-terminal target domain-containing protein [Dysgonomonas sp. 520]
MKKIYTSMLLAMLLSVNSLAAQTSLLPGDIAFVSINSSSNTDQFAFVLLTPIDAGTNINFTDCGWNEATGFTSFPGDSHFTWTADAQMQEGATVLITTNNGNSLPQASTGTISGSNMLISIAGDQIFAYQGTVISPSFIAGISFNQNESGQPGSEFDGASTSNSTTGLPSQLTIGVNAVHVYNTSAFAEEDNSLYNGQTTSGTKQVLAAAINNMNNWGGNNDTPFVLDPMPFTFSVSITTAIGNGENDSRITIYPNPTTDGFYVKGIKETAQVSLFDMAGNVLFSKTITENDYMPVQLLPKGVYLIRIDQESESDYNKLIVQ